MVIHAAQKIYPRIGLRDSDVILASFPKSGNTWMRFIWANIVSLIELKGREIDFHLINNGLNAEYDSYSYGHIEYDCLPRLVKTHKEYNKLFSKNKSVYLYRHPGDVMLSFYDYKKNQKRNDFGNTKLSAFLRDAKNGIPAWCRHVESWISEADVLITYEEMKQGASQVVRRVLSHLPSSEVNEEVVKRAVERSSFQNMRDIEEEKGRPSLSEGRFNENYRFTRKARSGEWKDRFSKSDVDYMVNELRKSNLSKDIKVNLH